MAGIGSKTELTCSDGSGSSGDVFNVDTVNGIASVPNNKTLQGYSDAYTTATWQIKNGTFQGAVSSAAAALATSGTVTTSGVRAARLNPGSAVTACVLGSGTTTGQEVWVVNEAAISNSVTFAASGSSFVADGVSDVIPGLSAKLYVWDNAQSAWFPASPQLTNGTNFTLQSATAAALATSGTVTTNGVGVARINPGSAVTACVLGSGTIPGQQVTVVNEAVANFTVQFAASASSFVADGINDIIPGLQMRTFFWDSAQSLWFAEPSTTNGTINMIQSATAAAIATSGTVTTAGVGLARLNPGSAVTACVLGSGTIQGQMVVVSNEAAVGSSVQFAASASSFIADGVNCVIPGLQARLFLWNGTNWFEPTNLVGGSNYGIVSATAPALAISGTISTANLGVTKVTPGSAVSSCVLAQGVYAGQQIVVVNESTTGANTITFAASSSSFVADGATTVISGLRCANYTWDGVNWFHS
jgi:hypothetical protein